MPANPPTQLSPASHEIVGKRTFLVSAATKFLAPYEFLPGFWQRESSPPRVVFIASLPRAGSTLAKRFLGDHPQIRLTKMNASHNWWDAWCTQRYQYPQGQVTLDKRTLYIHHLDEIIGNFGRHVRLLLIIRNPRDQLISLKNFPRHQSYPRDERFLEIWSETYRGTIQTIRQFDYSDWSRFLRYEDLVSHPESIKQQFLRWIGLPEDNLENTYDTQDPSIVSDENPNEDEKTHLHRKVHTQSIQKWKQKEDSEDVVDRETVRRIAGELVGTFDYDPFLLPDEPDLIRVDYLQGD